MRFSDRRNLTMKRVLLIALLAMLPMLGHAEPKPVNQRPIKVAFAISQRVNVMDVAGPWEVFADTSIKDAQGKTFRLTSFTPWRPIPHRCTARVPTIPG